MRSPSSHISGPGLGARHGTRRGVVAALLAMLTVASAGCGDDAAAPATDAGADAPTTASAPRPGDDFWAALRIDAVETDRTDSLAALVEQSDVVVRGRIRSFALGRTVGDTPEEALSYARATVAVSDVLRGEVTAPTLPVELVLPVPLDADPADHAAVLAEQAPDDPLVLFLRRKRGRNDQGAYRPVNAGGVWAPAGRDRIDTPLSLEPPEERFGPEVAALSSLDALVAQVRAAPGPAG